MEPTIYKPSIYNGAGVYNGAGGLITELPDAAINGKLFKNLLPLETYNSGEYIDNNLILKKDISASSPFVILGNNNFTLSENDTFEIQFSVKKDYYSGSHNTVFGSVSGFYNNISLDFGNVNDGIKSCYFGIPRSTSPSAWNRGLYIPNLVLTNNKWYTIKAIADENEIKLYIEDDDGMKVSEPRDKNDLYANSRLQLMGINTNSNNRFNGEIDLKNSYIKKNGLLVWGIL